MKTITNLLFLIFISLFVAGCGGSGGDDGDDDIDNEPPNTTISSGPASLTNSTSADFIFASNEPGTIFQCELDDQALLSCTSPANFTGLTEGSHSFSIVAMDEAGNIDPTPAIHNWVIDLTPPETNITSTPLNPTNLTSATFVFTSSEAGSTFQCTLDGVQANCTTPLDFTGLGLGNHSFSVEATDAAGNTDTSPATYNWAIDITADVTPPDTVISSGPTDPTNSTSASFVFTSTEAGSSFECALNGGAFTSCTSPADFAGLAEGNRSFSVRATDTAGNTDATPATYDWEIDITPPDTVISSGPADPTNSTSASFVFTSTEAGSSFECALNGGAFTSCTSPADFAGLAEGNRSFSVRATDAAGNTDATPATYNWEIDITPPDTVISSGPADPTNSTSASFVFTSTEAASTFECSLNGGAFSSCTSPADFAGLAEGNRSFSVRATDAAGNTDATPATYNWEIDITPPDTVISSGPADPTNSTSASFVFTSTEAGSSFECALNGGAFTSCTSPADFAGLAEGNRSFSVRATDAAGNTDATPATYDWEIDITPPDTSISSAPANPSNSTNASFEFTSSELGSTFQCSLDGGAFVSCTSPTNYTGLALGSRNFSVRAIDAAGNTDLSPATHNWVIDVDNIAPDTTSIVINNNAQYAVSISELTARLIASDNVGVTDYLVTEHNATDPFNIVPPYLDPLPSDPDWVPVTETPNLDTTIQFPLAGTYSLGDTVELCVWFMDDRANISTRVCDSIVYGNDWESGFGNFWFANNGVWQVGGPPAAGPTVCHSGTQCAATVLDGNYPKTNSNLVSPTIDLPTLAPGEQIQLRFWHWFSLAVDAFGADRGIIYIQEETSPGVFSAAVQLTEYSGNSGGVYTRPLVDLSAHAGKRVRILFGLVNISRSASSGWYIDDIAVDVVQANNPLPYADGFESGLGNWAAHNGTWQVGGPPAAGPTVCHSGTQCAATVLDGNYPKTNSNLVSPTIDLPTLAPGEQIQLRFWHWFSLAVDAFGADRGIIYIQEETSPGVFSAAVQLTEYSGNSGGVYTRPLVDLSAHAGKRVRILFGLVNISRSASSGWYIDDIAVDVVQANNPLPYADGFESGLGNWAAHNGTWQVGGPPAAGPTVCHSGTQCAATVLDGNYPKTNSNLVSPTIDLPTLAPGEQIQLRFWHWFSLAVDAFGADRGIIYIQEETSPGVFSAAVQLTEYSGNSGGVYTRPLVDLSAHAGKRVRILFGLVNISRSASSGWYIDDITVDVVQANNPLPYADGFESGLGNWAAHNGTWQVGGPPAAGPFACHSGTQCAATVLDGNYPKTNSNLVSPTIDLPTLAPGEQIQLRFWHWFSLAVDAFGADRGIIYIQEETSPGVFSAAVQLTEYSGNSGGVYTRPLVDLSAHAGKRVRILFGLVNISRSASSGWYIDDILIQKL